MLKQIMTQNENPQITNSTSAIMKPYSPKRVCWLILGLLCLGLGTLGLFLPLLPTTSFILLAAFAFARSSSRMHQWLMDHHVFGPLIINWQKHGAISTQAKAVSLVSMILVLGISVALDIPLWAIAIQFIALACVSLFLWTRPAPPVPEND